MTELKGVNVPLTDGQLRNIGLITVHWNMAEKMQENLLWVMIPTVRDNGLAISTHLSSEIRWNIILTLADVRGCKTEFIAALKKLQSEFNQNRTKRNEVVHAGWAGTEPGSTARAFKTLARGSLKMISLNYTEEQLCDIYKNIEKWTVDCANFMQENIGWPSMGALPFFSAKDLINNSTNSK